MIGEPKFMLDGVFATLAHGSERAEMKYECDKRQWMGQVVPWGSEASGVATQRIECLPPFRGTT